MVTFLLVTYFSRVLSKIRISERGSRQSKEGNDGGKNDISDEISSICFHFCFSFLGLIAQVSHRQTSVLKVGCSTCQESARRKKTRRVAISPEAALMIYIWRVWHIPLDRFLLLLNAQHVFNIYTAGPQSHTPSTHFPPLTQRPTSLHLPWAFVRLRGV